MRLAVPSFVLMGAILFCGPVLASDTQQMMANPAFAQRVAETAPKPTGDALFDRYAYEVWQRGAAPTYLGQGLKTAACLPDELLASWKEEFEADPRYWQLRYFCSKGLQIAANPPLAPSDRLFKPEVETAEVESAPYAGPDPLAFLEEGIARGAYDFSTLKELFYAQLADGLTREQGSIGAPTTFEAGLAERLLSLAQRMTREFPAEADGWSALAFTQFELGQNRNAVASLGKSSVAESNLYHSFFPLSTVLQNSVAGKAAGSKYVSGMVLAALMDFPPNTSSVWKKHLNRLRDAAIATGDRSDWQIIQLWCIRLASRKGSWVYGEPVLIFQAGSLARELMVCHPETLTVNQRERLWEYDHRRLSERTRAFRGISKARPDIELVMFRNAFGDLLEPDGTLSAMDQLHLFSLALLSPNQFRKEWLARDMGWGLFTAIYDDHVYEQGEVRDKLISAVQDMSKWDWVALDEIKTPEELAREEKYRALTDKLMNKELTMSEAMQEMQKLDESPN